MTIFRSPGYISIACAGFILAYYIISAGYISAAKSGKTQGFWRKHGFFDYSTSIVWVAVTVFLIVSLVLMTKNNELNIGYLILYYFFFIFLFAFCYGLLQWHRPGMLEQIDPDCWEAEVQYLLLSIQTQTTLGYTRAKPANTVAELLAAAQTLLGIFFMVVFVAKAVNRLTP